MPTMFLGCISCNTLLILPTDVKGAKPAASTGWQLTDAGWQCPQHKPVLVPASTSPERSPDPAGDN